MAVLESKTSIVPPVLARERQQEWDAGLAPDQEEGVAGRLRQLEDTVDQLRRKNQKLEAMARNLRRSLDEKEVMLHEIHHRVKNNLQVVQSLLKMSVRSLPEGDARSMTMNTAQRVYAMVMVHERLYPAKELAGIPASSYLRDLFDGVALSSPLLRHQVMLKLDADEIVLNIDNAIPFGLLANELLANCLKHGFPDGRTGTVAVALRRVPGAVRLVIEDNGVGLPREVDLVNGSSLGLKLAASLARQLGGELNFRSDGGCRVTVNFTRL